MNMEVSEKSKKTKKTTKSSTKNVKKKVVKKTSKTENKSARVKTNITKNETSKNKHNRKFTLDIIELLDGKVNKNIVFFGFLLLVFAVSLQGIEHLHHNQGPIYVKRINASNITLSYTLFCYWAYLMVKHGFILKSLLLLILLRLLLTFSF